MLAKYRSPWHHPVGLQWAQGPIKAAAKFIKDTVKVETAMVPPGIAFTSTIRARQYSQPQQRYQQNTSMLIVIIPTPLGAGLTKEADEI